MSVRWNRVFQVSATACGSGTSNVCPSSCYNFPSDPNTPLSSNRGQILQQFSLAVTSLAEVFSIFAEELKDRLGAFAVLVRSPSNMTFYLDVSLTNKDSDKVTVTCTPRGSNGDYPVQCSYEFVNKDITGNSGFMDLGQMLDWLVTQLRLI